MQYGGMWLKFTVYYKHVSDSIWVYSSYINFSK